MTVEFIGYQDKGEGKIVYLLEEIQNGMRPVLVRTKYGMSNPYCSAKIFEEKLSSVRPGDFVEIEFNRYGGINFK